MPATLYRATPKSVDELASCVAGSKRVHPHGARSKPRLANAATTFGATAVDLTSISGILDYEPSEFVFTALAGTPVIEVEKALAEHGQYLPFDPMFAAVGATLGGTVASGLSGPGRLRYGGVRDFIIGAKFLDGAGRKLKSGGVVVKNAAGFDFPKLFVGSLGRLGVLYELTFKVFPAPAATLTLSFELGHVESAIAAAVELAGRPFELHAVDISPPGNLLVRLGGAQSANEDTAARVEEALSSPATRLLGDAETSRWAGRSNCDWARGDVLLKVPTTASKLSDLDAAFGRIDARRRYCAAGDVAFASLQLKELATLEDDLSGLGLSALVLRGETQQLRIGSSPSPVEARIKNAFDPGEKFLPLA